MFLIDKVEVLVCKSKCSFIEAAQVEKHKYYLCANIDSLNHGNKFSHGSGVDLDLPASRSQPKNQLVWNHGVTDCSLLALQSHVHDNDYCKTTHVECLLF